MAGSLVWCHYQWIFCSLLKEEDNSIPSPPPLQTTTGARRTCSLQRMKILSRDKKDIIASHFQVLFIVAGLYRTCCANGKHIAFL